LIQAFAHLIVLLLIYYDTVSDWFASAQIASFIAKNND